MENSRRADPLPGSSSSVTYLARWILPIEGPALEFGFITVHGGRIAAIGRRCAGDSNSGDLTIDLGDVVLLPGFVNAHTHLEFSGLARPLGTAGMSFAAWVREVIAYRHTSAFDPLEATAAGLRESARFGVTTLGDITSVRPDAVFELPSTIVSVTSFVEVLGLAESRLPDQLARLEAYLAQPDEPFVRRAASPHAPYSTRLALVEAAVSRCVERRVPVAMHLAESREELELLRGGSGPFADLLRELGAWDPAAIPAGTTALDYLRLLSRAERSLVVHGNYLTPHEIEFLGANADRMSVIYCPRTHAYFAHDEHPLPQLLAAGAAVALGTDGRCTNPDLDLLAEMRTVARTFPELPPERILQLGTLDGARALGLADEAGSLVVGKPADFIAVAVGNIASNPAAAVLGDEACVTRVWKHGRDLDLA